MFMELHPGYHANHYSVLYDHVKTEVSHIGNHTIYTVTAATVIEETVETVAKAVPIQAFFSLVLRVSSVQLGVPIFPLFMY